MGASDGLGDGRADIDHAELGALPIVSSIKDSVRITTMYTFDFVAQRDGIGDDQGFEDAAVERLDGVSRQNAMSDQGKNGFGAILLQNSCGFDEGAYCDLSVPRADSRPSRSSCGTLLTTGVCHVV
jgi:hypothetical protein